MPDEILYRGVRVRASPFELQAGGWNHEGYIIEDRGASTFEEKFFAEGTSQTRDEAVRAILAAGKRKVDERLG